MSGSRIISIDVGGTFTDILCVDAQGAIQSYKLPSVEPGGFAAMLNAATGRTSNRDELLYSTTVTLNSLLAGELPQIGLIVTAGFRDILETARLPISAGEAPPSPLPRRLVMLEWVREISARLEANGEQRHAVDRAEVERIAHEYSAAGIGVVAVSLLHSYLEPAHEQAVAAIFAEVAPSIKVVVSSTVLPELREYERTLATALNSCLIPTLCEHIDSLAATSQEAPPRIWLMQSNGGLASATSLMHQPLTTALSGPGAAVVGMRWLGEKSGFKDLITLDVGGTSTDVALVTDGRYALTTAGSVAGFPLKTPMLDVLSIGAGGGSIAHEALDSRWHVGPESAGAIPGPACYGRGGEAPTLTDAQLVLGRIPDALLGGSVPLDRERALCVLEAFGGKRGFDAIATARGILEIASHNMCGAIRRVSVARGYEPSAYALLAMGGAGPLHAAELADLLGITTVVVPPQPGLAAAWGLLVANVSRDFVLPLGNTNDALDMARLETIFSELHLRANNWCATEGSMEGDWQMIAKLDLRYVGMSHETTIECVAGPDLKQTFADTIDRFHDHFEQLSGRSWRDRESVEIVNVRLTASGRRQQIDVPALTSRQLDTASGPVTRDVGFLGTSVLLQTPIFNRDQLDLTVQLSGPAIIEQYESTTVLPPRWVARVDQLGNLILARKNDA
jgi:N-methylhydantoinase A